MTGVHTRGLDPELAAAAASMPAPDLRDLPQARREFVDRIAALPAPDTTDVDVVDTIVPGDLPVPIRIYRPAAPAGPVGVLDLHPGGFVLGDVGVDHAANTALARSVGAVVVTVDYRLAPEHPFPAALDDAGAALGWFADHAGELGVDPARIALHGTSAGAGLAAALALRARDRGGPSVAFQFLAAPVLDDRLVTASASADDPTPLWDRDAARRSWDAYLGPGVRGSAAVSPYAAPARAEDLAGLPPAYVSVQTRDPLRDEGIAYAQRLLAADVPVELHLFAGTFHGSTLVSGAQVSRREIRERVAVLRHGLGLRPPRP